MASPGPVCRVCGEATDPECDRACGTCRAPHHADCWTFGGGCSIYGCGELTSVPALSLAPDPGTGVLVLGEDHTSSLPVRSLAQGLWRRFRAHAASLPVTLGYGVGATAAGVTALSFMIGNAPPWEVLVTFLGAGFAYGLLSPFVAPLQHRRPLVFGVGASLVLAVTGSVIARVSSGPFWLESIVVMTLLVSWMVAASAYADALLGPRSALGGRLGRFDMPARWLATWGVALVLMVGASIFHGPGFPELVVWGKFGVMAAMVALAAAPALEKGKQEYARRLLPSAEGS